MNIMNIVNIDLIKSSYIASYLFITQGGVAEWSMALRLGILNISFRNGKPREFEPRLHQRVLF